MSVPYWAKGCLQVTEPGMRLAAAKAAQKVVGERAAVGVHEDDFWVPATGDGIEAIVRVRLTRVEVEAEFPEYEGGGPERRLTERRSRFDRRISKREAVPHRTVADARSRERRRPRDRRTGDGRGATDILERISRMAQNKLWGRKS